MLSASQECFLNTETFNAQIDPCIVIIFGATGDLTARKLIPALYSLSKDKKINENFACVGFARRPKDDEIFRTEMHNALKTFSPNTTLENDSWEDFKNKVYYHRSEFDQDDGYIALKKTLESLDAKHHTKGNRLFYFSTPPKYFPIILEKLNHYGLIYKNDNSEKNSPWSRVIIEKPFGYDTQSAQELQQCINQNIDESNIYRIDHYLGKETVQNILTIRFANSIFESCWNEQYIDHVQITASESIGIGTRGNFFEESGMLRDMIQNHVTQLLCLLTMDPPSSFSSEEIKNEKIKILNNIVPWDHKSLSTSFVRGQYGIGIINGEQVKGYREEENVHPQSMVETFAATRLFIDSPKWRNVPFYLRAGKRLSKKCTEIAVVFKKSKHNLFFNESCSLANDLLVIRLQPDEGVSLHFNCKVPGTNTMVKPVNMDFKYENYFQTEAPEAYERLICECMLGNRTLFTSSTEVLMSWELFTPILKYWEDNNDNINLFPNYVAGSQGPVEADQLLNQDGRNWCSL